MPNSVDCLRASCAWPSKERTRWRDLVDSLLHVKLECVNRGTLVASCVRRCSSAATSVALAHSHLLALCVCAAHCVGDQTSHGDD